MSCLNRYCQKAESGFAHHFGASHGEGRFRSLAGAEKLNVAAEALPTLFELDGVVGTVRSQQNTLVLAEDGIFRKRLDFKHVESQEDLFLGGNFSH